MEEASRDCTNGTFVTVVSIGNEKYEEENINTTRDADFVTVLRIGEKCEENEDITEEVLVYRLPGERLGFGLKFEGGTKAAEYVKRLFIQSCAPDSPASRVLSSWGNLTEGDEVLVIDSQPVNSMTRMDCVKCLKDSNLIIKLLVRHFKRKVNDIEVNHLKSKIGEDLPQVISAEKKKIPPPPPPVPPRKVPRRIFKSNQNVKNQNSECHTKSDDNNPLPPVRQKHADANNNGNKAKITKIRSNSPEFKRKRKHSDGSIGPPDAEFYVDLISQESLHSLSESDDTASTISTVIDRNGSSLPSTPRSTQKHLDISNFPDDEELFNMNSNGSISSDKLEYTLWTSEKQENMKLCEESERYIDDVDCCDETMTQAGVIAEYKTDDSLQEKSKESDVDSIKPSITEEHDENMNIFNLPRLVDFVPKICNELDQIRMMTLFLENERSEHYDFSIDLSQESYRTSSSFDGNIDIYSKWSVAPQLATIGEVEEESINSESLSDGSTTSIQLPTPLVIVHDADTKEKNTSAKTDIEEIIQAEKIMEPLPSDPRQPPDGHEFPDFEENYQKTTSDSFIDKFTLNYAESLHNTSSNLNGTQPFEVNSKNSLLLTKPNSMSTTDLGAISGRRDKDNSENKNIRNEGGNLLLHTRSQSLCDISFDKRQNDHWQNLYEQRRKTMSKLKGLVIPDAISEADCSSTINLPEIQSSTTVSLETFNSLESSEASNETSQPSSMDSSKFPLISPPWTGTANFPKYSPAFKRKDLQLYSTIKQDKDISETKSYKSLRIKKSVTAPGSSSGDDSTVPMESVDSSPTRSENSFECVSSINKFKPRIRPSRYSMETSFLSDYHKNKEEMNTEDESDNDSAVSSSQSSFISRPTASPSPTMSAEYENESVKSPVNRNYKSSKVRHLKSASVEAINRKNILASAKCRSGKDLKVGSPVINRKLENPLDETGTDCCKEIVPQIKEEEIQPEETGDNNGDDHKSIDEDVEVRKTSLKTAQLFQPQGRRLSSDSTSNLPPKATTNLLKTKFEDMTVSEKAVRPAFTRAVSRDSAPIYRDILKPVPPVTSRRDERISRFGNTKSLSVTDLRKNFEDIAKSVPAASNPPTVKPIPVPNSRKSEPILMETSKPEVVPRDAPEIKARLLQKKQKSLDVQEPIGKFRKVILTPDVVGGSIGITLAGGTDENKEITVHRIRYGSVAYHEGNLTKGDHIVSINDTETKGLTHHEAAELLKAPVKSFVIKVAVGENVTKDENYLKRRSVSLDFPANSVAEKSPKNEETHKKANHEIVLQKDGNGLGFSVEGGRDSPQGDVPLIVKKIFQGGVAEKDGLLKVGDEILAINDIDFTNLSRIQAWTMMKKIDVGNVKIMIYR